MCSGFEDFYNKYRVGVFCCPATQSVKIFDANLVFSKVNIVRPRCLYILQTSAENLCSLFLPSLFHSTQEHIATALSYAATGAVLHQEVTSLASDSAN